MMSGKLGVRGCASSTDKPKLEMKLSLLDLQVVWLKCGKSEQLR